MTLLTPLGLLGLLGILVLILIYIIKPNYQQRLLSSTFVWRLSLKYKKKRIPISKLRNFLIILCQILILTAAAMILAQPNQILKAQISEREVIVVIDSSASMRTMKDEESRFERAVNLATENINSVFDENGIVSVMIADSSPEFIVEGATSEDKLDVAAIMEELIEEDTVCSYGQSDIPLAIEQCTELIKENPDLQIFVYTDKQYAENAVPKGITIVPVAVHGEEWNAAIVNAYTEMENNYYMFIVEVAYYGGADRSIEVVLDITNANAIDRDDPEGVDLSLRDGVDCNAEEIKRLIFVNEETYADDPERFESEFDKVYQLTENERIFSYEQVHVSLDLIEEDNFILDNNYDIYDGLKEIVRIQYASGKPNVFFSAVLSNLRTIAKKHWDIKVTEVKEGGTPAIEGFDFYIFEHIVPEELPEDGVVMLVNPEADVTGGRFKVEGPYDFKKVSHPLTQETEHPILKNINVDNITVSRYMKIQYEGIFEPIVSCDTQPVLSVLNEPDAKMVIMAFSLHYSNLPIIKEFPLLIKNIYDYFFPTVVDANSFEVYEKVTVRGRGESLHVNGYGMNNVEYTEFPAELNLEYPGTYTLTQYTFADKETSERIYVKIPVEESNIFSEGDLIENPFVEKNLAEYFKDLMVIIAAVMVAILFIEWLLSASRDAV